MNLYRYAGPKALILERCIGRTRDASSFGLPCSESIFSSSSALPSHHRELSLALSSAYSSLHCISVIKSNYSIGGRVCQMEIIQGAEEVQKEIIKAANNRDSNQDHGNDFFDSDYMNRGSERPETIGIRLCQRASMEDRGAVDSDMISPSSAG